jgi:putative thiamine transport system ATP-binding protein
MTALILEGVAITHRGQQAPLFPPISLCVPAGQIVTVMGPSGIGKSTLLECIAGLLGPEWSASGRVLLGGRDLVGIPPEARRVGMVFQEAGLFPHLSVGENLAFGLSAEVRGRTVRRAAVDAALDSAGLAGFFDRDPATLSGGQRARAALMRTLLARPAALLLDEPFSRLDLGLRTEIRQFVFDHVRAAKTPALLVTHDPEDGLAAGGALLNI